MPAETSAAIVSACSTPPSSLTAWQRASFENPAGVFDRPVRAQMKAGKRHIDDHQRLLNGPADHLGMVDHFIERHGQRAVVPLHDHRHAVADQNAFDAGRIHEPRQRVVVSGDDRDFPPRRFERGEFRNSDTVWSHGRVPTIET